MVVGDRYDDSVVKLGGFEGTARTFFKASSREMAAPEQIGKNGFPSRSFHLKVTIFRIARGA